MQQRLKWYAVGAEAMTARQKKHAGPKGYSASRSRTATFVHGSWQLPRHREKTESYRSVVVDGYRDCTGDAG